MRPYPKNSVKEKLSRGDVALGVVIRGFAQSTPELIGLAGFDYAWIDLEHGSGSFETAEALVRAGDAVGIESMIRVPDLDASCILRALETGASIVCVPRVETTEDARKIAQAARFHPAGLRGFTTASRGTGYGMRSKGQQLLADANSRTMVVAQIETRLGVSNVRSIAAVDGIDVLLIGLGDLSQEMGCPGAADEPTVLAAALEIAEAGIDAGKFIAVSASDHSQITAWRQRGASMFFCGVDLSLLGSALLALRSAVTGTG